MACIIDGCKNPAEHNLGIRLRRPNTKAIWAPNLDAFVCDDHAARGLKIEIILMPTGTGEIETEVRSQGGKRVAQRKTPIRKTP
jgi:hypothetical protein